MEKLAIIFPGQGSQSLGMVEEILKDFPEVSRYFEEASAVLGYDLCNLINNGPVEALNQTEKTQPALLATSYAIWHAWQKLKGPQPVLLAGHSIGEYTALTCAGGLDFPTAVELVAKRGRYMQQAVPEGEGAMAAIIGLDDGRIEEICEQAAQGEVLTPANYNAIGQVVIAGNKEAVERAINLANDAGAKLAKILQVSVPSHCPLMQTAAKNLAEALIKVKIKTPKYQIINNVDVVIQNSEDAIKDALVRQLYKPVRWVEVVLKMREAGVTKIVECGPGKVLCGLIKRIDRDMECFSIHNGETITKAISSN